MKKLLLLLCVVILAFSCKSDDEPSYSSTDLVGTWLLTSILNNGEEIFDESDCKSEIIYTETTVDYNEYYGEDCSSVYEASTDTYKLNGKNIIIDGDTLEILELTSKKLKVKEVYEEDGKTYIYIETYIKVNQA